MNGRVHAAALLVILLLAGCAASPEAATPDPRTDPRSETPPEPPVDAPDWRIGDYWSYQAAHGATITLVVAEDGGNDWIVHPTDPDTAFHHARDPISYLGAIRKADLAGSQGTDRVQYFQWPLADGATWTTRWDGLDVRITATRLDQDRFRLNAMAGDTLHAAYTYDPRERWFTRIAYFDEDGNEAWGMRLDGAGRNHAGDTYRYDAEPVLQWEDGLGEAEEHPFTVPDGTTDLWLHYRIACDAQQGAWAISVGPDPIAGLPAVPDPESYWDAHGTCPDDQNAQRAFPVHPGAWRVLRIATPMDGTFEGEAWLRTQHVIPVG